MNFEKIKTVSTKRGFPVFNEALINGNEKIKAVQWPQEHEKYELIEKIGKGATSEVYKATEIINRKVCAIKVVKLDNIDKDIEERIHNEIATLSVISHPNIMKIHTSFSLRNIDEIWMVMPFIPSISSIPIP